MAGVDDTIAGAPPPSDGPRRLGRYLPIRELGRGGMGVVYVAHDPNLGRDVALKVLLAAGRTDPTAGPRLIREAQAAAKLQHPGIVVVLDLGLFDGLPYLAMELVDGPSLSSALKGEGPLAPTEAARLGAGLARALEHAHAQGVVHRDLKPANVLLAGPRREPKIVDFGLAKDTAARGGSLTTSGELLGTPAYMAPEQADGSGKRADGKADVYALGATLHAMLTGEPPFQASSALGLLTKVLSDPARPPSARRAGIPPALDALVLRCLEKEPSQRPTAAQVAEALEALAQAPAPTSRRRGLVLATLAVLAVAAAGLAVVVRRPTDPGAPSPLEAPLEPEAPPAPVEPAPARTVRDEPGWRWTRWVPSDPKKDRSPVVGASALYVPARRVVLALGARGDSPGVWAWDATGWTAVGDLPESRYGGGAALDVADDAVVYLGGFTPEGRPRGEQWITRATSPTKQWLATTGPGVVTRPAVVWSATGLLLFGGDRAPRGEPDGLLRAWDRRGWRDLVATPSPPPRAGAAACWDARRRRFVLFGGSPGRTGAPLGDVWEWDGATWREGPPGPPARSDAAMAFDGRRCVLVGGIGRADDGAPLALGDTWAWDGEGWCRLAAEAPLPPRSNTAFAWHQDQALGLLVGGQTLDDVCPDTTWTLTPPEPEPWPGPEGPWPDEPGWSWQRLEAPGEPPPSDNRVAVHDPDGGRVLVLGGHVGADVVRDVLAWDGVAWTSAGELPEPRHAGAAVVDPGTSTLHYAGGRDPAAPGPSSDLWSTPLRPGEPLRWERTAVPEGERRKPQRSGRARPGLAWDEDGGRLLLLGGTTEHETLDDLWVRSAGAWSRVTDTRRPPARFGAAMAWDSRRKRLVVFGGAGRDLDDALGDVWEWDGAWHKGLRGPPARAQACLVFDGRRCLLVGGAGSDRRSLDDAWAWDGQGWARLAIDGPRPSRRARAALAWDSPRRVAVLVGGSGQAGPCPDVAWELKPPAR